MRPPPFIVAYGLGVDSTAMIIGLHQRRVRPDAILFADVGSEKPGTYAFLPRFQRWLKAHDMPPVTVVRRTPVRAPYTTLEQNMVMNATLPGATFNKGSCTIKWKIEPQNSWTNRFEPAQRAWAAGQQVIKAIGFDAGEDYRQRRAADKAHQGAGTADGHKYRYVYPLMDWGWDRERCKAVIAAEGLPVPPKSACFFCPNMKPHEVDALSPELRGRIIRMELAAEPYNRKVEGLWRRTRQRDGRPGSITRYILERDLPFTPLTVLGQMPLNPDCGKFARGDSVRPPHKRPLRDELETRGHRVPEAETEAHLDIVEHL